MIVVTWIGNIITVVSFTPYLDFQNFILIETRHQRHLPPV